MTLKEAIDEGPVAVLDALRCTCYVFELKDVAITEDAVVLFYYNSPPLQVERSEIEDMTVEQAAKRIWQIEEEITKKWQEEWKQKTSKQE